MQLVALVEFVLFCAAVLILSSLVGLVFAGITATFIKGVRWRRRLALSATSALPFACLALFVLPIVLLRVVIDRTSLPGSCVLPNGYKLMLMDAVSPGWVYDPENEFTKESINWKRDSVDGVLQLQVAGNYILGGRESHGFPGSAMAQSEVDSYFVLDTKAKTLTQLTSLAELQSTASRLGIQLELEGAHEAYERYGLMRFARVPRFGTLFVSLLLVWLLVRWALRLRRFRSTHPLENGH